MFNLIMIETTLRGKFDRDQTKHVKNADYEREGEWPKDQDWAYCEKKCLVEMWDDEEIQQQ